LGKKKRLAKACCLATNNEGSQQQPSIASKLTATATAGTGAAVAVGCHTCMVVAIKKKGLQYNRSGSQKRHQQQHRQQQQVIAATWVKQHSCSTS